MLQVLLKLNRQTFQTPSGFEWVQKCDFFCPLPLLKAVSPTLPGMQSVCGSCLQLPFLKVAVVYDWSLLDSNALDKSWTVISSQDMLFCIEILYFCLRYIVFWGQFDLAWSIESQRILRAQSIESQWSCQYALNDLFSLCFCGTDETCTSWHWIDLKFCH